MKEINKRNFCDAPDNIFVKSKVQLQLPQGTVEKWMLFASRVRANITFNMNLPPFTETNIVFRALTAVQNGGQFAWTA